MPLIECPDCGKQISPYAEACPNCGCPKWRFSGSAVPPLKRGDRHFFGLWGGEAIEWRVLDVSGGRALLISEKVIDCSPYNDRRTNNTWEESILRRWLNGPFLQGAFDDVERASIALTTVPNPDNVRWWTLGDADTRDSVFCLSIDEAKRYFRSDADRKARPTAKAVSEGAYVYDGNGCSHWWLRSLGRLPSFAAFVDRDGAIECSEVNRDGIGVRPAIYLNLP